MNKVINKTGETSKLQKVGSYYTSTSGGCYILVQNGEFYSAHDISSGCRWNGQHTESEKAVNGLKPLGHHLKITIENQ